MSMETRFRFDSVVVVFLENGESVTGTIVFGLLRFCLCEVVLKSITKTRKSIRINSNSSRDKDTIWILRFLKPSSSSSVSRLETSFGLGLGMEAGSGVGMSTTNLDLTSGSCRGIFLKQLWIIVLQSGQLEWKFWSSWRQDKQNSWRHVSTWNKLVHQCCNIFLFGESSITLAGSIIGLDKQMAQVSPSFLVLIGAKSIAPSCMLALDTLSKCISFQFQWQISTEPSTWKW